MFFLEEAKGREITIEEKLGWIKTLIRYLDGGVLPEDPIEANRLKGMHRLCNYIKHII